MSDLLLFEIDTAPGAPVEDVREVSNYVAALDYGLGRIRDGFPLSLRLLREIHSRLLEQGRGAEKEPGEFRSSQNWIGGTRPGNAAYVPPSPDRLMDCLGDLEKLMHDDPVRFPILVKTAMVHAQFETIHPFLDGNGRLGRMLITLLLCSSGTMRSPLLYLSLYFKTHQREYYELLQRLRTEGDWEEWLTFFATAIRDTAGQAVDTVRRLHAMAEANRKRLQDLPSPNFAEIRAKTKFLRNFVS